MRGHDGKVDPAALTDAEQLLWEAFGNGTWPDFSGESALPVVRANVIAALMLGAREPQPGWTVAVRLRGATATGRLDLAGDNAAWPVIFENCPG